MDIKKEALHMHEQHKGKFEIKSKVSVTNATDLSLAYTPGVAEPCKEIAKNPKDVYRYTAKGNTIAVISDGTAVLGLGNIGPKAAIPVMEGKAVLFKEFGGIDAIPICLDTTDTDKLIETITYLAPSFGGINLEDIASPKCFEIEKILEERLDIPVFHDDQHGTAIVVCAGLINALKFVKKDLPDVKIVLNGPGAAGTAIIHMLLEMGATHILACDEFGILHETRQQGIVAHKVDLCKITNPDKVTGNLSDAVKDADVFIGVSVAGALTKELASTMNKDAIVFAMANPTPEIFPDEAKEAGVAVVGTGRSDFPNQINNVLAFPGVFKGALEANARDITYKMKIAAAYAIAGLVDESELTADYIIPPVFDKRVAPTVSQAVANASKETKSTTV